MDSKISQINKLIKEAKAPTPTVKAVEILFELHYKALYSLAFRLTRDPQQSKDIVSETFSCLLETGIAGFHTYSDIEKFLFEKNEANCMAFLNQVRQEKISVNDLVELQSVDDEINEDIIQKVRELYNELPENKRRLIKKQFIDGESLKQIAATMNMNSRAVHTANYRILNKFREALISQFNS